MARYIPIVQFLTDSGAPLNAGTINTYITGTTTNKATYQDQAEGTAHANPIVLDSDGRPPGGAIWVLDDAEYTFLIKDSDGNTIQTIDDMMGVLSPLHGAYETHNLKLQNGRGLLDDSGNEVLLIGKTASAVNEITVTNAATGGDPKVGASGDDTNIDIEIEAKGTGQVKLTSNSVTLTMPSADGSNGQFLKTNGSGALSFGGVTGLTYAQLGGMELSNDTDTDHDISIAVGACRDSTDAVTMALSSAMVKRIDANWSAGTGNGGLPTAVSLTADTWYHVFIIQHTDGTTDAGYDTSSTATNLLSESSYTYYRRIGSVLTDSSANILQFIQNGDIVYWKSPTLDVDVTNLSTTRTNYTIAVPPDVRTQAICRVHCENAAEAHVVITNPDLTDSAPSATATPLSDIHVEAGVVDVVNMTIMTNTSKQIAARSTAASTTLRVVTAGYIDNRGK